MKASKAQAGFRLMLFYKSEMNFRLQFKFRIKRREGTQLYIILQFPHFCTTDGILENHINLTSVSYWFRLLLHDCIQSIVPCHIMDIYYG